MVDVDYASYTVELSIWSHCVVSKVIYGCVMTGVLNWLGVVLMVAPYIELDARRKNLPSYNQHANFPSE